DELGEIDGGRLALALDADLVADLVAELLPGLGRHDVGHRLVGEGVQDDLAGDRAPILGLLDRPGDRGDRQLEGEADLEELAVSGGGFKTVILAASKPITAKTTIIMISFFLLFFSPSSASASSASASATVMPPARRPARRAASARRWCAVR